MQITLTKIMRRSNGGIIDSVHFYGIRKTKCKKCNGLIEYLPVQEGTTCIFCTRCRTAFEK